MLSHGEWRSWLEERVEFSERSAQRFMRLAREWSNPVSYTHLDVYKRQPESGLEIFFGILVATLSLVSSSIEIIQRDPKIIGNGSFHFIAWDTGPAFILREGGIAHLKDFSQIQLGQASTFS